MNAQQIKDNLTKIVNLANASGDHGIALDALDKLGEKKPGIRTTEFWLATATSTIGTILVALPGKETYGACLIGISMISYALSRGLAKAGQ